MPPNTYAEVLRALPSGQAAIIPTDTVFGLAVSPLHAPTPAILYQIKGRPSDKPVAWLVSKQSDLDDYGIDVPEYARELAKRYWPGPLTIIVKAGEKVPLAYRSAAGTIGLRMPADELTRRLADEVGCPLAVTSANRSGASDPRRFADLDAAVVERVSAVADDAQIKSGIASTVLDCTGDAPRLVREGEILQADIDAVLRSL